MTHEEKVKKIRRLRRTVRIRSKIQGTEKRPRLTVFASNRYFYAQLIDDTRGNTLVTVTEKELDDTKGVNKTQKAQDLGGVLAKKAKEHKIQEAVFDKGRYKYHGRVKAFAEGAREGGLKI